MKLSIVTTLYHSELYLKEFYERTSKTAKKITHDYEFIFVNDGSPDKSLEIVLSLLESDRKVKVLDLSRNFGHHKAIMTGLSHARGDLIFLIDCDLEEDPENLESFYNTFKLEKECDVVYGQVDTPKGGFLKKITDSIFYGIFNHLSDEKMNKKEAFSRLMSQRYVKSLVNFQESELFLMGLWQITGYHQVAVRINTRFKGSTTYTFKKKVSMAFNALTSFSYKPILYISYLGFLISLVSSGFILFIIIRKIFFESPQLGWSSVIVSIWFMGGLILLSTGIIGIYVSKIFIETKKRPYTIIKHLYENNKQ